MKKQMTDENRKLLEDNIQQAESRILIMSSDINKMRSTKSYMDETIKNAIAQQRNNIMLAEVKIEELSFDLKNAMTKKSIEVKIKENEHERKRLEGNIKVWKKQIGGDEDGQPEAKEAGQQESGTKPET